MIPEPTDYITYLLRLWRAGNEEEPSWRATLENPHSGERQTFGDLAALFAFLEECTRRPRSGGEQTSSTTNG